MKRILLFNCIMAIAFISCDNNTNNNDQAVPAATSPDSTFHKLSEDFISGYLAWRPQTSVSLGFHEYDGKITNFNRTSLDGELARLKTFDQQLGSVDTAHLSVKAFYDYRILRSAILNELFNFEDMEVYTKNPMTYAGVMDVNIYVKRNFAPIEDRIKSIIAIEQQAPNVFAAAKINLTDSLAKPYIETAIQIAEGSAAFLKGDLVIALKDVKNDSLMNAFNAANKTAIDEVNAFADYLKKEKLPKSHNHYALGKEKYRKMLLYAENITISPEEILGIGLKELKKEQDVFNSSAKIIDPTKKPVEVYHNMQKEHPTAQSLIPDAQKNLERIRQFLVDKKIVTMPSEVRVQVKETPQYARSTSTASMDTPGPFEKKATEAYYYITPVDSSWTAKQKEDWLAQFDYYTTDNVTIHEAYPGHYTQFLHLNASSATKIEKIFGSYAFIEGWAHYCEKMMADEGYGNNGDSVITAKYRLAQSGDALLRLCRLCVSIKTHCQNMSVNDATKFFKDNWFQGDKPSRQEALRGTFDPGYLFYTLGKLEILKLQDDYKKQESTNFSLQKFHDLILDNGMPGIALLRELLLKDKTTWEAIL
jgi:uncharacterized protein (DUF885 family)